MTDQEEMTLLRLQKKNAELVAENLRLKKQNGDLIRMHTSAQCHIGKLQAQLKRKNVSLAEQVFKDG